MPQAEGLDLLLREKKKIDLVIDIAVDEASIMKELQEDFLVITVEWDS